MHPIAQVLARLFKASQRVSARTGKGLLRHGVSKYSTNAVRRIDVTINGVRIAYDSLNEVEKAAVDEIVDLATRFAFSYIEHHDEHSSYRLDADSLEDLVMSHANEIVAASRAALISKANSIGYDLTVGKPERVAIFQDEDLHKQFIIATISEIIDDIIENAEYD